MYSIGVPESFFMYRSLSDLRDSVARLIEQQGEDAPCAAFIFTKEDVRTEYLEGCNPEIIELDCDSLERAYPGIIDKVLQQVSGSYIYEEMAEFINQEVTRIRNK